MNIIYGLIIFVTDLWTVRKWRKRWGTPIDKGNQPAQIPIDFRTQSRYSQQYQIVKEMKL